MNELLKALDHYYDHPVDFSREILRMDPDEWQEEVLGDLAQYL